MWHQNSCQRLTPSLIGMPVTHSCMQAPRHFESRVQGPLASGGEAIMTYHDSLLAKEPSCAGLHARR